MTAKRPKQEEIAWAAGLFEGEGCINVGTVFGKYIRVQLTLFSIDRDVVDRFASIFGGSVRERKPKNEHHKTGYVWRAHGKVAAVVLRELMPWFGDRRREKAVLAIEMASLLQENPGRPKGFRQSPETKARISASLRKSSEKLEKVCP